MHTPQKWVKSHPGPGSSRTGVAKDPNHRKATVIRVNILGQQIGALSSHAGGRSRLGQHRTLGHSVICCRTITLTIITHTTNVGMLSLVSSS